MLVDDIPYVRIDRESGSEGIISEFIEGEGPGICEVFVDPSQDFEPKVSARVNPDGSIESPTLDDMTPFLSEEEYKKNRFL